MKETEITVQVFNEIGEINDIFCKNGFKFLEKYHLHDTYFSKFTFDELAQMEYKDIIKNSLLIREVVEDKKVDIIYKNKEFDSDGNVLSEEKIKVAIGIDEPISKLLVSAGLTKWSDFVDAISVYQKGDVYLLLQEIEGVGRFIEFEETESMKGLSEQEKFEALKNYLQKLNLKLGDDYSCKKQYLVFKKNLGNK